MAITATLIIGAFATRISSDFITVRVSLEPYSSTGSTSVNAENLTIGGLAAAVGVNVETVRYYQRIGLMPNPRKKYGSIRRYGEAELRRLRFVRRAQQLGFTLDEVGQLLGLADERHCAETRELAEHKLTLVRAKLRDLRKLERILTDLVGRCAANRNSRGCPIIDDLGAA